MALRLGLLLGLVYLAFVVESFDAFFDLDNIKGKGMYVGGNVQVGDAIDMNEEMMMMESESARRGLQVQGRYVSYAALKANRVPCKKAGRSYYNCKQRGRANPYKRGCSAITRCMRFT